MEGGAHLSEDVVQKRVVEVVIHPWSKERKGACGRRRGRWQPRSSGGRKRCGEGRARLITPMSHVLTTLPLVCRSRTANHPVELRV